MGNVPLLLHRKAVPHVWRAEIKRLGIEHKTEAGYAQCSSLRPTGCTWLAQAGVADSAGGTRRSCRATSSSSPNVSAAPVSANG